MSNIADFFTDFTAFGKKNSKTPETSFYMSVRSINLWQYHRYLKKSRLLKFCYVPATSAASSKGIFVAATISSNQTNKVGSGCH